jgi:hypothetical protein
MVLSTVEIQHTASSGRPQTMIEFDELMQPTYWAARAPPACRQTAAQSCIRWTVALGAIPFRGLHRASLVWPQAAVPLLKLS